MEQTMRSSGIVPEDRARSWTVKLMDIDLKSDRYTPDELLWRQKARDDINKLIEWAQENPYKLSPSPKKTDERNNR